MKITCTRIDNRLLHGITATQWAPEVKAQRIMVIDDEVAQNQMLKNSMKLARPAGMAISIISLDTALENFKKNKYDGQSIFILVRSVEKIIKLVEAGVPIESINLGATAQREEKDLIEINRFVTMNSQEKEAYKWLESKNIPVYASYLVADPRVDIQKFLD